MYVHENIVEKENTLNQQKKKKQKTLIKNIKRFLNKTLIDLYIL